MSQVGLIFKKIPQIMKAVGAITKDRSNSAQGYKFRGIEDMYNAFHPVFAEHGVFCAPEVIQTQCTEIEGENASGKPKISYRSLLTVRHRFYAEDGSFIEVTTLGEGIDTSDKASNKAMSAAMKYAFIELFSVPTEDIEDSDRTSPDAGRTMGRIVAGKPCIGDGVQMPLTELGNYVIPISKELKGKKLSETSLEQLKGLITWLDKAAERDRKDHAPKTLEFINHACLYIVETEKQWAREAGERA